jgi:hypothetical protein
MMGAVLGGVETAKCDVRGASNFPCAAVNAPFASALRADRVGGAVAAVASVAASRPGDVGIISSALT